MNEDYIIQHIKELCIQRNWSYYQLAKSSDLPYSTISTLLNHHNKPAFTTLARICDGFGISIADFFDPGRDMQYLSPTQRECLELFNSMSAQKQQIAIADMKGLLSD